MNHKQIISLEIEGRQDQGSFLKSECEQAVSGLMDFNHFKYLKAPGALYKIKLAVENGHLVFHFKDDWITGSRP